MFRLCIVQSTIFANKAALKICIREKRVLTKLHLTNNETVERKETSILQDTSEYKVQLNETMPVSNNPANHTICSNYKKTKMAPKEKMDSTLSESNWNEKRFKAIEQPKSFSIFDSEAIEDSLIRCIRNNDGSNIPSVTNILNETMSVKAKLALEIWKRNIIDNYGEFYFIALRKELLRNGKLFHSCVQNVLSHKEVEIPHDIKLTYNSVECVLNEIQTVHALEAHVAHPVLQYKGIVDCIATYRDQHYVIDWKKSGKQKASLAATYDAPVQLAAYIGAVNASKKYPFRIDRGLVVVAYTTGEPATVHEVCSDTLQKAWIQWLNRLEEFYNKLNAKN